MSVCQSGAVLALLFLLLACGKQGRPRQAAGVLIPDPLRSAAATYEQRCRGCHGSGLEGTEFGPSLDTLARLPDSSVVAVLGEVFRRGVARREGRPYKVQGMTPKPDLVAEAPALAAYVRWLGSRRR